MAYLNYTGILLEEDHKAGNRTEIRKMGQVVVQLVV